ncbi:hypothetical protein [Streptomyces sp. NPDC055632]
MIGLAPAGHIHRHIDCELTQVGPRHLKLELQLIALSRMLDDIQAEDDRRPRLRAREERGQRHVVKSTSVHGHESITVLPGPSHKAALS